MSSLTPFHPHVPQRVLCPSLFYFPVFFITISSTQTITSSTVNAKVFFQKIVCAREKETGHHRFQHTHKNLITKLIPSHMVPRWTLKTSWKRRVWGGQHKKSFPFIMFFEQTEATGTVLKRSSAVVKKNGGKVKHHKPNTHTLKQFLTAEKCAVLCWNQEVAHTHTHSNKTTPTKKNISFWWRRKLLLRGKLPSPLSLSFTPFQFLNKKKQKNNKKTTKAKLLLL